MKLNSKEQKILERTTGLEIYRYPLLAPENVTLRNWELHGTVNRVLLDEPKSIVLGQMLWGRKCWNQDAKERPRNRNVDGYFTNLLGAVGIKDRALIAAMKTGLPMDAEWSGYAAESMLFEIIMALLHADLPKASEKSQVATSRLREFPPWYQPMVAGFAAIVDNQPELLQNAIQDAVKGIRRVRATDPIYKIVYPPAHHLWQLGEYCRPGMLQGWHPPPVLPWDQAYQELVESIDDASDILKQEDVPDVFRPLFEVLPWN